MVTTFAFVVGTLVLGLASSPGLPSLARPGIDPVVPPAVKVSAAVDSFSPPAPKPKKKKVTAPPRPASLGAPATARAGDDDTDESPRRSTPGPAGRRRPAAAPETEQGDSADSADQEDEEEDQSKAKRKPARRRVSSEDEDEQEDDDAPLAARPVVLPRLISIAAGGGLISRSFSFNAPLQKDSRFPRPGLALALETFPLVRAGSGWLRHLGAGADLAMEFGAYGVQQGTSGTALTSPVSQRRYGFDIRYAFIPAERVVIVPAVGIGNNTFVLKSNMSTGPSMCTATNTQPCIPGIEATYLIADLHLRVAATDTLSVTLSGGYLLGLAVGRGNGQIGQERTPKMSGFHVELGGNLLLTDWLAVRMAVPFISHAFSFSGGTGSYTAATETYVGGTVSAILFTQ